MQRLYTPEQVAKVLKVKIPTVHRWLREGTLEGIRVGRLWRITHSQFEDFIGFEFQFMDFEDKY